MVKNPSFKENKEKSTNDLLFGSNQLKTEPIVIIVSQDLKITDLSDSAARFLNQPRQSIIRFSLLDLMSNLGFNIKVLSAIINSHSTELIQTFELTNNKNRKNYSVTLTHLLENNHSRYIFNISPVNQSYELLKSYINSIINNLPGAVYWKDLNGKYMGCNKFVATMAGYDNPEDMVGKTDYDLCWHEFADQWRALDNKVIEDNQTVIREENVKLSNGRTITELTFKTPLKNEYNETIGVIGTSLDITEQKSTQNALILAKEAAEAADIAKTEFIANMSHDIRTPLSGVVGLGGIVEQEIQDPAIKAKIHNMVKSADELLNMLNEILDVVSLDNISVEDLREEPFDLAHLIQSIIDLEKSSVDLKKIQLLHTLDTRIPPVLIGDHKKIHHILLNLVGNAIKFTKSGQVNIKINLSQQLDNQVDLLFIVQDTGVGIPAESLMKVFDLFYKVTPSYKGLEKGHGVGLHIVKTYTELLGSKIAVESTLNAGSTFSFTLRLKIAEKGIQPQNTIQSCLTKCSKESSILQSKTPACRRIPNAPEILLIEDNYIARTVAQTLIQQAHCNPSAAPTAEIGLELAKNTAFDLILTDIGLPGMSGIEFTQLLRQHEKNIHRKPVPIIAVTGHGEGKYRQQCLAAGINDIVIKPIRPDTIPYLCSRFQLLNTNDNKPILSPFQHGESIGPDLPQTEAELFILEGHMLFDIEGAKKIIGNNTALLMDLLKETLYTSIPEERARMQAAYKINDWHTIAKIAHKLKGGFLSICLSRAATACKYLERYHKTGKTKLLEPLYKQLLRTLELTTKLGSDSIDSYLEKIPNNDKA